MAKRFTATEKWTDKWFRALSPEHKLGWQYLCDNCDAAGVIDLDRDLADFQIGRAVDWDALLLEVGNRISIVRKGKWWLTGFIQYQYGRLSPHCKPHLPVIQLLERHQIPIDGVQQNDTFKCGNIDPGRRLRVFERDNFICVYCNEKFEPCDLEPDHVTPASRGGTDSMTNLVAACRVCNRLKRDRELGEFVESLPDSDSIWKRLWQRLPERLSESLEEKEKEQEKDKDKEKEKDKGGVGGFVRPTLAEVEAYCRERGGKVNAQAWYDHYESNGWRVGRNPMKNWKAAVRKWESSEYGTNGKNRIGPGQKYDPTTASGPDQGW